MSLSVVILAAGKGTRMKSPLPKVLHKISGKPMIWHIVNEAKKLGEDVTLILGHEAKSVEEFVKDLGVKTALQDLKNYPGTGGALKGFESEAQRVLVLNGDMPLVTAKELEKFLDVEADIVMGVIKLKDPSGYGRVVIKESQVEKIVEQKDATKEELKIDTVNAGVYLIKTELLKRFIPALSNQNAQKEYYLTDIIEMAKKEGYSVKPVFVDEESFMGVNSKLDLAKADEVMQKRIKERAMLQGVTIRAPQTVYIDIEAGFEGECEIESCVVIKGKTIIKNSHIKSHSRIEESQIEFSSIGPYARIRPGSIIQKSHIGNFVEVKKSRLNGVKAGHLTYLGDSEIESGTNIGAGVITCNYDGKSKYKTKIGKNVFVGSDSQLIAPIVIEDDVIIAAGTTLNKDVPKGSMAISRAPLKIIKDFYYKFFGKK